MPGNDSFTKILLHMDGSNGGTTFTDSNAGGAAKTWTLFGTALTNTSIAKFGVSSMFADAAGGGISTPDSAEFVLGSGDWTVDYWFNRFNTTGVVDIMCGQAPTGNGQTSSFSIVFLTNNTIQGRIGDGVNAGFINITSVSTYADTAFHHLALVREGSTLRLYLDGVQEATVSLAGVTIPDAAGSFYIGRTGLSGETQFFNGAIDEFRLSVGVARYPGGTTFTPATAAYSLPSQVLTANVGAFAFTGIAAFQRITIALAAGAYVLVGQDNRMYKLLINWPVDAGAFVMVCFASILSRAIGRVRRWVSRQEPTLVKHRRVDPTLED